MLREATSDLPPETQAQLKLIENSPSANKSAKSSAPDSANDLKKQIEDLKKSQNKNKSIIALKNSEIKRMETEIKELKQAKKLCEQLHVFDESQGSEKSEVSLYYFYSDYSVKHETQGVYMQLP